MQPLAATGGPSLYDGPVNAQSFQQLLLPELDALWRFTRHLTREEHAARDLMQAACLKALENAASFEPKGGGIRPWLFCVAHNLWRNQRRDTRRETSLQGSPEVEESLAAPADADTLDLAKLDWEQVDQRLKEAIGALDETHRMPLLLWAVEDMAYRDIAQTLDIPLGTVMSRLHRARTLLSVRLRGLAEETGVLRQNQNKKNANRVVAGKEH
jgi:RNA polymerase sigma-70 factor (ECF subfamily)